MLVLRRLPDVSRRKIEQQDLAPVLRSDRQLLRTIDGHAVSSLERGAVQLGRAAGQVQPPQSGLLEAVAHRLAALEQRRKYPGVLLNAHRAVRTVRRSDQAQPTAFLLLAEVLLLVAGRQSGTARLDPDLQEVHRLL